MSSMLKKVTAAIVISGFAAAGIAYSTPDDIVLAQRHSCGYHCNPDGSAATPAAPTRTESEDVILVGRTNVHSGGRAGGKALPRTGAGGAKRKSMGWV